jgi:hypothetical protein
MLPCFLKQGCGREAGAEVVKSFNDTQTTGTGLVRVSFNNSTTPVQAEA